MKIFKLLIATSLIFSAITPSLVGAPRYSSDDFMDQQIVHRSRRDATITKYGDINVISVSGSYMEMGQRMVREWRLYLGPPMILSWAI